MPTTDRPDPLVDPEHRVSRSADRETRSRAGPAAIGDADHVPRPVLLIGGPPESSLFWTKVQPLLHGHSLTVLTTDRPSHPDEPAGCLVDNAAAIARLLDKRHASPAVIVAHSLGTGTALALATTAPHHVHAVVLIDPDAGPVTVTRTDRILAARIIGPALSWVGFRAAGLALHIPALRAQILTRHCGLSVTDAKKVVRSLSYGKSWRSFTAEQRRLVTAANQLQKQFSEIRCPVVIVTAARDRGLHPHNVAAMAKQLPAANIITTDAQHVVPTDHPETVVVKAVLQAFTTVPNSVNP
jgi:pimeloyl-ACP methyl ester carboxylesterase